MKVKIGNRSYDATEKPIAIILTDQDKKNIQNMHNNCTMYAIFPDDWGSKEEMQAWLKKHKD
ncbi:hypothetical protein [Halomonas sp. M20]|uniref:hypothetical protein n=1 Tax=Halomonas sp. M20 TaxID=2763264 RepID=UPI001D09A23E|nr:hypothetical protein [Halomonas sp. M20]